MSTYLEVREKDHKQNVILILEKGEQITTTLDCIVRKMKRPEPDSILFPRTAKYKGRNCRLIRYSEKQDVLFYRVVE